MTETVELTGDALKAVQALKRGDEDIADTLARIISAFRSLAQESRGGAKFLIRERDGSMKEVKL